MYDEMTVLDLIATAFEKVNAGDEHGSLITELASRLSRAQVYRENIARVVDPYLREEDGSDLIPDHARIANMLERLSLANSVLTHQPATKDTDGL
jgi:hypothetical protein